MTEQSARLPRRGRLRSGATPAGPLRGQLVRFAIVGVGSTALSAVLFAAFQFAMSRQWANVLSLVISTIANTAVNRRFTFGVSGREGAAKVQVQALILLAMTIAFTAAALKLLELVAPDASTLAAVVAFLLGNVVATCVRFVLLRRWFGGS